MKNSILFAIFALILVIAGSGYYFYSPPHENILGRALVLMFVNDSPGQTDLVKQWEKVDLSVEIIDDCAVGDDTRRTACTEKHIERALKRINDVNKPLLVLADKGSSQALLSALNDNDIHQIAALILLQASGDETHADSIIIPKTLVVSDVNDLPASILAARTFASDIREHGQWSWATMLVDNGDGLLSHSVLPHMVSYLIGGKVNPAYRIEFNAESQWQNPVVNNKKFFELAEFVEKHQVDQDIHRILKAFYAYDPALLKQWPLREYKAFNLIKYRNSLPGNKQGRFAVFSNRKGHKFYLDLLRYEKYKPEFVIAIDDEENLYRMTSFYKTRRFYSWEQGGPADDMLYAQSLGAFIHFQNAPPLEMELPYLQYSSILFESIHFTDQDPYEGFNQLSEPAFEVLTLNCLPCHSINGVGGSAHHLDYLTVTPQPGFAQPLLNYSNDVLENFFFNQSETAQLIGVNPNYVEASVGKELKAWLLSQ
tara:strand:+ start:1272 stop:2720 length:1449 start_codon:yes stop_codon:yes gene_type:complete